MISITCRSSTSKHTSTNTVLKARHSLLFKVGWKIQDVKSQNIRMPTGNESGANDLWLAGGKLPTGHDEAVIDQIPKGKYTETPVNPRKNRSSNMRVIKEKKFNYVLMEDGADWFLTFLSGGPVEIDFCVKLSEDEIDAIKDEQKSVQDLIRSLQSDHDNLIKRRIIPSLWP